MGFQGFAANSSVSSGLIEKREIFTAAGTWTKPAKLAGDNVWVTGIGGGGGGGNGPNAGGGDGGEFSYDTQIDVSAISSATITIGSGGAGVAATADGNSGGVSSFGALLSLSGGFGGQTTLTDDDSASYTGGARGGSNTAVDGMGHGQDNPCPFGGNGGLAHDTALTQNGGGGGLVLDATSTAGESSATTSTADGGIGYGAGGGAGRNTGTSGAGADGAILVRWMETL